MKDKIETLFDYMKSLCESDLDRIISFVMGIVSTNGQLKEKPNCPYCGNSHVIKWPPERKTTLLVPQLQENLYAFNQHLISQFPFQPVHMG